MISLSIPCLAVFFLFANAHEIYIAIHYKHLAAIFVFFHINDNVYIPCLAEFCFLFYLWQRLLKLYTHVHLYIILIPFKCYVTVTNIFFCQPYCSFTSMITNICLKDILLGITICMYVCVCIYIYIDIYT